MNKSTKENIKIDLEEFLKLILISFIAGIMIAGAFISFGLMIKNIAEIWEGIDIFTKSNLLIYALHAIKWGFGLGAFVICGLYSIGRLMD